MSTDSSVETGREKKTEIRKTLVGKEEEDSRHSCGPSWTELLLSYSVQLELIEGLELGRTQRRIVPSVDCVFS